METIASEPSTLDPVPDCSSAIFPDSGPTTILIPRDDEEAVSKLTKPMEVGAQHQGHNEHKSPPKRARPSVISRQTRVKPAAFTEITGGRAEVVEADCLLCEFDGETRANLSKTQRVPKGNCDEVH